MPPIYVKANIYYSNNYICIIILVHTCNFGITKERYNIAKVYVAILRGKGDNPFFVIFYFLAIKYLNQ